MSSQDDGALPWCSVGCVRTSAQRSAGGRDEDGESLLLAKACMTASGNPNLAGAQELNFRLVQTFQVSIEEVLVLWHSVEKNQCARVLEVSKLVIKIPLGNISAF